MRAKTFSIPVLIVCAALAGPALLPADPIAVRYAEGLVHGFLALRTLDGTPLANGDLIQVARGVRVTSQLAFHFKDGSLHDETTVFSQSDRFRLLSYHPVQKGSTFPRPLDMTINAESGQVTVHYSDGGKEKVENEHLDLPPDLANGMMIVLLKNVSPKDLPPTLSYVAATPKPRLVKLVMSSVGSDAFSTTGLGRRATHYVIKVEIGGLAGVLAQILGKEPPDNHVWILESAAPAFVKSEGPLYLGGPSWRIELTSPVWPPARPAAKQ
jgi:hypothetical protein